MLVFYSTVIVTLIRLKYYNMYDCAKKVCEKQLRSVMHSATLRTLGVIVGWILLFYPEWGRYVPFQFMYDYKETDDDDKT